MIWHLLDFQCQLLVFIFMNVQEICLHYPVASHKDLIWARFCSLLPPITGAPALDSDADDSHISTPTDCAVLSCSWCWFGHCLIVMTCLHNHALCAAKAVLMCKYWRTLTRVFQALTPKIQENRKWVTLALDYSQLQLACQGQKKSLTFCLIDHVTEMLVVLWEPTKLNDTAVWSRWTLMRVLQVEWWEDRTEIKVKKKGKLRVVSFRSLLITQPAGGTPGSRRPFCVCVWGVSWAAN